MLEVDTLQLPNRATCTSISHSQKSKADSKTRKVCRFFCPLALMLQDVLLACQLQGLDLSASCICREEPASSTFVGFQLPAARITTRSRSRNTWYIRIQSLARSPTHICTVKASLSDFFPENRGGQILLATSCPFLISFTPRTLIPSRTDVAPHYSVPPSPYASLTSHLPTTAAIFIRTTTRNFNKHTTKNLTS
jgi:hypothetical protein